MRLLVTVLNIQTLCSALRLFLFTQLIQLNSLFLTGGLGLGKKERVPRGVGALAQLSRANLKASPSRVPD